MINKANLQRPNFDLSDKDPVHVILNTHQDIDDHYFDMHYEFEVGVLINGRMKREYFGHQMEIGPGDVWLCGMWEPHGYELLETPCEALVFVINPTYLANNQVLTKNILSPFQASPCERPGAHDHNRSDLIELAQKTKEIFERKESSDWAKLQLFQLLLLLVENWQAPLMEDSYFSTQESIQPALRYVFDQKRLISTEEAALACNMSASKFRNSFKKLMNRTFSDFAREYRVRGAKAQLKNTRATQESVALNWGFTDASHLHKNIRGFE